MAGEIDGTLGADWFRDRIWTFDYSAGRLLLRAPGDLPAHDASRQVSLGIQVDPDTKQRTSNFPRITVWVDDQPIDLLLDTGATALLTEVGLKELHDGQPAARAGSFITATTFSQWHAKHPEWRVIEGPVAMDGDGLIEVPLVEIAGYKVGPVWFLRQPDRSFRVWMAQWMDRKIEGSLGGNALRYFRVTVDYPDAIAVFEENVH